jgi:hypothetical protein
MSVVMTAATRAELAKPKVQIVKTLEVVRDLFDGDSRTYTDVSKYVRQWGILGGVSTLKSDQWEIPGFAPTVTNLKEYFSPGHPSSVWVAIAREPEACWVRLRVYVTSAIIRQYIGKIKECEPRRDDDVDVVVLRTVMGADEGLDRGINKHSGDEQIVVYNDW